jgi:hypothetical protein
MLIGDVKSHEVHKSSIRSMVAVRGGLENLGHDGRAKCALMSYVNVAEHIV